MTLTILRTKRALSRVALALTVLAGATAMAQVAPAPAPDSTSQVSQPKADPVPVTKVAAPSAAADEAIQLSPFEVTTENNRGYFAANSMSGTRFNTKIEDLASALTVITKEQMTDFAMIDINDVFLYTANAEGTGTYSDFVMNRNGELTDNVSLNPTSANRIRGIASANVSYGNFETINRAPLDPIVLEGVEISRGPNANVFGLGNPSGTVNQVPVSANLTRDRTSVTFRGDSYGGYRSSLDVNRVILRGKLAVRVSGLTQHEGFAREPSGIETRRFNAMVKYQPFKNTTISASYLDYRSWGNRPNFTPPRDFVSYWVQQGKPSWDPVTQTAHVNGVSYGPYTNDNFIATAPFDSFNRSGGQFQRSNFFIDRGGFTYWTTPVNNTGTSPTANTGSGVNFLRLFGTSPGPNGATGKFVNQPLFSSVPTVFNKALYDYTSINLAAPNYTSDATQTYMVTLDQVILNTPRQLLVAQAGFFREDSKRFRHVPIGDAGQGGQNGQLWVDVNERNLDGTVNPMFGHPYIGVNEPISSFFPSKWDTYRAQLAYRFDFTQTSKWTKWLGSHQISPYYEYKYRIDRRYSYREANASTPAWLVGGNSGINTNFGPANQSAQPGNIPNSSPNITREFFRFYVGDANGYNVDYAPSAIPHGTYAFNWGTTGNWRAEQDQMQRIATSDATGGSNNRKIVVKTQGTVLQDTFFGGKLITAFGLRKDSVYSKFGVTPIYLLDNNTSHDFAWQNHWATGDYKFSSGQTKTAGVVARPFRDLKIVNQWASSGGMTGFFGELVKGLSLYYNTSDNFIVSPPAIDLFRNQLPSQTGTGKDYGLWLNLFKDKLVIRINRYQNKQLDARDGDANTIAQRLTRLDGIIATDRYRLYQRATDWFTLTQPGWTPAQVEAATFSQMQMTRDQFYTLKEASDAGTLGATNDILGKGTELEINYNSKYWRISANIEEKQSMNANISTSVQRWIDLRMPIWQSIVDPNTNPLLTLGTTETAGWVDVNNPGHFWYLHNYGGSQTPAQNFAVNVEAPWSIIRETEGKPRPQIRRYAGRLSGNVKLAAFTDHRIIKDFTVGGAIRWEDKAAIGYYGVETYPAVITRLNSSRPIYDGTHTYFDAYVSYKTKLFADKVTATFSLNARNLQEGGRLQAVGAFPNGEIHSARIVDPRQFILSASFDL